MTRSFKGNNVTAGAQATTGIRAPGAAYASSTLVTTAEGKVVEIGSVRRGDRLLGPDGSSCEVLDVTSGTGSPTTTLSMVRVPYSHTAAMLVKHSGVDEQIITERLNSLLGGGEFPTEPLSQPEAGDVPEDRAVHDVQSFVDAIKHGVAWMLELNGVMNVCVGPKAYSVKIRVFNDDLSRSTRLVYFSFDQTFTGQSAGGHKTTWYASKEAAYDAAVTFARAHQDSGITLGNLTTRWQIERSDMDKPMRYSRVDAAIPGMNLMQCGQSDPYLFVQAYKRYNFVGPVTLDYLELAAYLAMPPNEQKLWRVARAGAMDFPDKDDPPTPPVLWPVAGRWFTQVNSHLKLR
ncbi:uncharacterized protein EHS24_004957 [Apiotrichum porosum]|uniref:Uncharacterized protein n=1 Tax=Apiotrichum porosum TaxID=105984 RepID=A0A427Y6K1_9TREE|nr:uncharacterized protein EHS24_004957 [Apiotrichum porosum]RSH86686.1 hypothetical protein EHS24_004957 [Apiotrichum porosum]